MYCQPAHRALPRAKLKATYDTHLYHVLFHVQRHPEGGLKRKVNDASSQGCQLHHGVYWQTITCVWVGWCRWRQRGGGCVDENEVGSGSCSVGAVWGRIGGAGVSSAECHSSCLEHLFVICYLHQSVEIRQRQLIVD